MTVMIAAVICAALVTAGCADAATNEANAASTPKTKASQITLSWSGDTKTTQDVNWKGSGSTMYVKYAAAKNYDQDGKWTSFTKGKKTVTLEGHYCRYSARITKLTADTKYYYIIGAGSKWTAKRTFTTGIESGDFSFMSLGDVQFVDRNEDYAAWGDDIAAAYKREPGIRFSLMTGDLINVSTEIRDWNAFFNNAMPVFSRIPMMTTSGNHETPVVPSIYLKMMSLPKNGPKGLEEEVYSFDYGDCHFVSLNSNLLSDKRRERMGRKKWNAMVKSVNAWLKKDLKDTDAKWKIAYMHHPAYPAVDDGNPIYKRIRTNWSPVFASSGTELVLCGHQHLYMRTKSINGVTYMMADSGYKPTHYYKKGDPVPSYAVKFLTYQNTYEIYNVSSDELKVTVYRPGGQAVDQFAFTE